MLLVMKRAPQKHGYNSVAEVMFLNRPQIVILIMHLSLIVVCAERGCDVARVATLLSKVQNIAKTIT